MQEDGGGLGDVEALHGAGALDAYFAAADGTVIPLEFDTICVHGDTPGAADLAVRIRAALVTAGIDVRPPGS